MQETTQGGGDTHMHSLHVDDQNFVDRLEFGYLVTHMETLEQILASMNQNFTNSASLVNKLIQKLDLGIPNMPHDDGESFRSPLPTSNLKVVRFFLIPYHKR